MAVVLEDFIGAACNELFIYDKFIVRVYVHTSINKYLKIRRVPDKNQFLKIHQT